MTIGEKIKDLRKKKGLTQTELAVKLETTKQTIHKYESGIITNLPTKRVEELAEALDTTVPYLLGYDIQSLIEADRERLNELRNTLSEMQDEKDSEEQKHAIDIVSEGLEDLEIIKSWGFTRVPAISPAKQKLLDAVDTMDDEQLDRLLKIIEAVKGM